MSPPDKRIRAKGRASTARFAGIPHRVMDSLAFIHLGFSARSVLMELCRQYNGYNNGDLTGAWKIVSKRGFSSRDTVFKALRELETHRLIVKTRQGGKNRCNLYALTWVGIDYCKGKLDIPASVRASNNYLSWVPEQLLMSENRTTLVRKTD